MTDLLNAFNAFQPMANMIAPKRSTLPILSHIAVSGGKMIATDQEHRVEMPIDYDGEFTIDFKMLTGLVKNKHDSIVLKNLTTSEGSLWGYNQKKRVSTSIPEIELLINDKQKLAFKGRPLSEYPSMHKNMRGFKSIGKWDAEMVKYLVDMTPFVTKDELKPSMMGVFYKQEDRAVELCGTDGHRLRKASGLPVKSSQEFTGIITPTAIKFVAMFMGKDNVDVAVNHHKTHMRFTLGNGTVLYCRVIDERYPDYMSVFRDTSNGTFRIERKALLAEIKSANQYANKTTHQGALQIKKDGTVLTLSTSDIETQIDWEGEIPVLDHKGAGIEIGYNLQYLDGVIKSLDGDYATFDYDKSVVSTLITGDDERVTLLLMPIRLND